MIYDTKQLEILSSKAAKEELKSFTSTVWGLKTAQAEIESFLLSMRGAKPNQYTNLAFDSALVNIWRDLNPESMPECLKKLFNHWINYNPWKMMQGSTKGHQLANTKKAAYCVCCTAQSFDGRERKRVHSVCRDCSM